MATTAAGKPFDEDLFSKLVLLMDSANEFERHRAAERALEMCSARALRFCDKVAQTFGQGKQLAILQAQLEEARRGGDALADALAQKDAVIEEYRKAERTRNRVCRPCEMKRRAIGAVTGAMILAGWFTKYPPQEVTPRWSSYGVLLAVAPLVFLFCRWRVICFKRKRHWVTWRDNDVFRAVADTWNGFLSKFVVEV
jgi:hypothetical protein